MLFQPLQSTVFWGFLLALEFFFIFLWGKENVCDVDRRSDISAFSSWSLWNNVGSHSSYLGALVIAIPKLCYRPFKLMVLRRIFFFSKISFLLLRLKIGVFTVCSTISMKKILEPYLRFEHNENAAPRGKSLPAGLPLCQGQTWTSEPGLSWSQGKQACLQPEPSKLAVCFKTGNSPMQLSRKIQVINWTNFYQGFKEGWTCHWRWCRKSFTWWDSKRSWSDLLLFSVWPAAFPTSRVEGGRAGHSSELGLARLSIVINHDFTLILKLWLVLCYWEPASLKRSN